MRSRSSYNKQNTTQHIQLNTGNCKACWACIEKCPKGVLGKIDIFFHRHAKIKNPAECTGCLQCLTACKFNAIIAVRELGT
jgi:uncharacterized Fe-S center protein